MAIISDSSTDITLLYVDEKPSFGLIDASKTSASGAIKNQVSGERLKLTCRFRTTSTILRQILDLLKNGSDYYYYTSEDTHGIYSDVTFPLQVKISKLKWVWDNRSTYYGSFIVESVDYI